MMETTVPFPNTLDQQVDGQHLHSAGNVFNWKIQHNVLHHTYTNIKDHDEDLEGIVLRFSKHAEWKPHHRFQWYGYSSYFTVC